MLRSGELSMRRFCEELEKKWREIIADYQVNRSTFLKYKYNIEQRRTVELSERIAEIPADSYSWNDAQELISDESYKQQRIDDALHMPDSNK